MVDLDQKKSIWEDQKMIEWKRYCVKPGSDWTEKLSVIDRTYKVKIYFAQHAKMLSKTGYREGNQNLIEEKMYDTSTARGECGAIISHTFIVF